jgi:hypothetical protein
MKKIICMIMGIVVASCALLQGMEKNLVLAVGRYEDHLPECQSPSRELLKAIEFRSSEIWNGVGFCSEKDIDMLQNAGAELNPEVYRGTFLPGEQMFSPLHVACGVGNCSAAEILLKKGAKIDVKDWNNEYPWNTLLCEMSERYYGSVYLPLKHLEKTYTFNKTEQFQAFFDKITSLRSIENIIRQRVQGKISDEDIDENLQEIELLVSPLFVKDFDEIKRNISNIRAMKKLLPKLYIEGAEKNFSNFGYWE